MARLFNPSSAQWLQHDAAIVTAYPFTFACWFYLDNTGINIGLMSVGDKDGTSDLTYIQLLDSTDSIRAVSQNGAQIATATGTYSANTWTHACCVWPDAETRHAYRDGGNKGSSSGAVTLPGNYDQTTIGALSRSGNSDRMSGRIAEAGIWSVALTDAEVAALAKGFSPRMIRPASLVAYWPLFGNDSPERDRSKNRFDMTLVNGPTKADHPRIYYPH